MSTRKPRLGKGVTAGWVRAGTAVAVALLTLATVGSASVVWYAPDAVAAPAGATTSVAPPTPTASPPRRLGPADRSFLPAASAMNLAEVRMAHIAMRRSGSVPMRKVATAIITDHTRAQRELERLAAGIGFALPTQLSPDQLVQVATLTSLRAPDFDTFYLQIQLNDHAEAIQLTQREVALGTNRAVTAYAEALLPVLRRHLRMATQAMDNEPIAPPVKHDHLADITVWPSPAAAVSAIVTIGPLADGAKTTGSNDAGWLIGALVVFLLGTAGGIAHLSKAAMGKRH